MKTILIILLVICGFTLGTIGYGLVLVKHNPLGYILELFIALPATLFYLEKISDLFEVDLFEE